MLDFFFLTHLQNPELSSHIYFMAHVVELSREAVYNAEMCSGVRTLGWVFVMFYQDKPPVGSGCAGTGKVGPCRYLVRLEKEKCFTWQGFSVLEK